MQIKMHDGMVRKLDCWYVANLWKNLIYLGSLSKNGLRYVGEGDWVKISKGDLVIMNGNMNHRKFYILEGGMVMGIMGISQLFEEVDDKT